MEKVLKGSLETLQQDVITSVLEMPGPKFLDQYELGSYLGVGSFGMVRKVTFFISYLTHVLTLRFDLHRDKSSLHSYI